MMLWLILFFQHAFAVHFQISNLSPIGDVPSPRENGCMSSFGNVAVLFGGRDDNTVFDDTWLLYSSNNSWLRVKPSAPAPRFAAVCVALNRELILIGGRNLSHILDSSIIWSFDVNQRRWRTVDADQPELVARAWAVGGVVNGKDILITHGRGVRDFRSDAVTLKLEGNLAQVRTLTPSAPGVFVYGRPAYVVAAAFATISDGIMVVGGCSVHGRCPSSLAWFLNATTAKWGFARSAPAPQFGACMTRVPKTDILLLLGGQVSSRQTFNRANVTGISFYRLSSNTWYQHVATRDANVITNRVGASLVALDSPLRFVMFGGRETTGQQRLVQITNVFMFDSREVLAQKPTPRVVYISVLDVHGLLMFGAFGIGFPAGLYIARLFRFFSQRHYWFVMHYSVQALSFVLAVFGSAAILSTTPVGVLNHVHTIIGVILLTVMFLQIAFTIPCIKPRVDSGTKREVWEIAHRWTGRTIVNMGFVNCTLGMLLYVMPLWMMVCWLVYLVLYFLGCFSTNIYHLTLRWRKPTAYEPYDENSKQLAKKGTFEHDPSSKVQYGLDWYPA